MSMNTFEAVLVGVSIAALISIVITTLRVGISPMPSSRKARRAIIEAIPSGTCGTIIDLGSGWGNLAFSLAQSFPQATIRGIELSLVPWFVSQVATRLWGFPKLSIERANFKDTSLANAEVVVCYLFPDGMTALKSKFEKELKPNTLIVSNTFRLAGWEPQKVITLNDIHQTPIYSYRVPAREEGKKKGGPS